MLRSYPRTRRWLLIGAIAAGAAICFGGGLVAANAIDEDNEGPAASDQPANVVVPGLNTGKILIAPNTTEPQRGGDQAVPGTTGRGADMALLRCGGGVLGNIITGSTIDLSKEGLTPRLLGSGFLLRGLNVYAAGSCEKEQLSNEKLPPALNTQWLHEASGFEVSVGQQLALEPVANLIDGTSATFVSGGYTFWVWVGGPITIATDLGGVARDDGPVATASSPPSLQQPDPRSLELLTEVISALAPELGPQCFHHVALAGWEALPGMGIGDPRPAIPAGYVEESLEVRTLVPPQSACGNTAPTAYLPNSFNATFLRQAAGSFGGLFVGASAVPPGEPRFAGNVNEYGANWSDGKYYFHVGAKTEVPIGREVIVAIARALDPGFDNRCLQTTRELSAAEAATAGFRTPSAPGYRITRTSLQVSVLQGDCSGQEPGPAPQYQLGWSLEHENGASGIEASVHRLGESKETGGHISQFGLSWTNGRGDYFNVNGHTRGISPVPPRDDLIAVAKSLDPSLDVDKLEPGVDKPIPLPMPVPERAPDQPKP